MLSKCNKIGVKYKKIHIHGNETYESYRTTFNVCTYARITRYAYVNVNNTEAVCGRSDFRSKRLGFVRFDVFSNEARFCNNVK